jgi:hypothetical protein
MNVTTRVDGLDEGSALMESFQNATHALGKLRHAARVSPRGRSHSKWGQLICSTMVLLCVLSTPSIVPLWQVNGFQYTAQRQQQLQHAASARARAKASFCKPSLATSRDALRRTDLNGLELSMNRLPDDAGESFSSRFSTANRVGWGAAKGKHADCAVATAATALLLSKDSESSHEDQPQRKQKRHVSIVQRLWARLVKGRSSNERSVPVDSALGDGVKLVRPSRRLRWAILASMALGTCFSTRVVSPEVVHAASAPVMALPKAESRDPVTEAMGHYERQQAQAAQRELNEMAATARAIEAQHGEAARIQYERDYKQEKADQAAAKQQAVLQLKRDLLDQGICPFVDLEGQRQVVLLEKGVDLGTVAGTPFYLEQLWETKSPYKSMKVKKAAHRRIVASMVQDMKNRGIDPLDYFAKHTDQTEAILDMKPEQALRLLSQYEANLEQYGQITVPKDGEVSAKDRLAATAAATLPNTAEAKKLARQEAAQQKAAERQQAKAAKELAQREAKAAKELAQREAKAAKEMAQQEAMRAKQAEADVSTGASDDELAVDRGAESTEPELNAGATAATDGLIQSEVSEPPIVPSAVAKSTSVLPVAKAAAAIVTVGGGAFAFKVYRDQSLAKEEERQRQFRLLMNGSGDKTAPPLEIDTVIPDQYQKLAGKTTPIVRLDTISPVVPVQSPPPPPPPKKKGLGLRNVFKKKSERETDLQALVGPNAEAPEFATTLAKILSLGAPGRFPRVAALSGGSPALLGNPTLTLDEMARILVEAQTESGLSREQALELLANVVNCMLIEMVDLASSSLKENDDQITIDAMNIVVDFMNLAAFLYDAIADGILIKPVTYGGDLSKSKLEQMFATYACSTGFAMGDAAAVPDDFEARVSLLRDVFEINEKKAEGLIMKATQKNIMQMVKDGKGMAGMEEMMKNMGGMDGLAGMDWANGEDPNPEQIKEMLVAMKQMKDAGSFPPQDFEEVKKQFHVAFGASMEDAIREADANEQEMSATDKEIVQLLKEIMAN